MALAPLFAASGLLPASISGTSNVASATAIASASYVSGAAADVVSPRAAALVRSAQFWLAVAALAALETPHWLEASAAWQKMFARRHAGASSSSAVAVDEPRCDNHDDGSTLARLRCEMCAANLCYECFSVLHLNRHKKTHAAKPIGTLASCPRIDVHEACTRLRLNNLLVSACDPEFGLQSRVAFSDHFELRQIERHCRVGRRHDRRRWRARCFDVERRRWRSAIGIKPLCWRAVPILRQSTHERRRGARQRLRARRVSRAAARSVRTSSRLRPFVRRHCR